MALSMVRDKWLKWSGPLSLFPSGAPSTDRTAILTPSHSYRPQKRNKWTFLLCFFEINLTILPLKKKKIKKKVGNQLIISAAAGAKRAHVISVGFGFFFLFFWRQKRCSTDYRYSRASSWNTLQDSGPLYDLVRHFALGVFIHLILIFFSSFIHFIDIFWHFLSIWLIF